MKKAILARASPGELITNDPKEESAVELLKEVLEEKFKITLTTHHTCSTTVLSYI
jgi:hypothetical protein